MKVTGPDSGAPSAAADQAGQAEKVDLTDEVAGATPGRSFAETLAAGGPAAGAPAATTPATVDPLTADIAADLKAGKVDIKAALDRVVERVLDLQLGSDAPPALRAQLRETLRDTMNGDPFLADKLKWEP